MNNSIEALVARRTMLQWNLTELDRQILELGETQRAVTGAIRLCSCGKQAGDDGVCGECRWAETTSKLTSRVRDLETRVRAAEADKKAWKREASKTGGAR